MSNDDVSDWVENDVEKFKSLRNRDERNLSLTKKMEYAFWGLTALAVVGMIGTMFYPGVGPQQPISGIQWLGGSLGGIIVFGAIAMVLRQLPEVGEE